MQRPSAARRTRTGLSICPLQPVHRRSGSAVAPRSGRLRHSTRRTAGGIPISRRCRADRGCGSRERPDLWLRAVAHSARRPRATRWNVETRNYAEAAQAYAAEHDRYYSQLHQIHGWFRELCRRRRRCRGAARPCAPSYRRGPEPYRAFSLFGPRSAERRGRAATHVRRGLRVGPKGAASRREPAAFGSATGSRRRLRGCWCRGRRSR